MDNIREIVGSNFDNQLPVNKQRSVTLLILSWHGLIFVWEIIFLCEISALDRSMAWCLDMTLNIIN